MPKKDEEEEEKEEEEGSSLRRESSPGTVVGGEAATPSPDPSEDSSDSEEGSARREEALETEEERAALNQECWWSCMRSRRPAFEVQRTRTSSTSSERKTCGSEGAAKDRQAAKRLLRKRYEAPKTAEKAAEAATVSCQTTRRRRHLEIDAKRRSRLPRRRLRKI